MNVLGLTFLQRLAPLARPLLRISIGSVMALHGYQKLSAGPGDAAGVSSTVSDVGLPFPVVLGWIVTIIELAGGFALILGLFTRLFASAIAVVLAGVILLVKAEVGLIADAGNGAELELALLVGAVTLALLGPGAASLDYLFGIDRVGVYDHHPAKAPEGRAFESPAAARRVLGD